ncbi:ankyrin repeat protein [Pandoravirus inopinatum]|uniref:Ankyrin repeat protein n=1 Tax=Pandoravirus inopinatum TaxID=1605721 RepID=A0A0B5J2N2_9VIRU|nr:ankyrin repeat protein [Pandoravirus inopinatum]AJF97824.1 ankyrin repeat protein [Pandoravirus inopinatum]
MRQRASRLSRLDISLVLHTRTTMGARGVCMQSRRPSPMIMSNACATCSNAVVCETARCVPWQRNVVTWNACASSTRPGVHGIAVHCERRSPTTRSIACATCTQTACRGAAVIFGAPAGTTWSVPPICWSTGEQPLQGDELDEPETGDWTSDDDDDDNDGDDNYGVGDDNDDDDGDGGDDDGDSDDDANDDGNHKDDDDDNRHKKEQTEKGRREDAHGDGGVDDRDHIGDGDKERGPCVCVTAFSSIQACPHRWRERHPGDAAPPATPHPRRRPPRTVRPPVGTKGRANHEPQPRRVRVPFSSRKDNRFLFCILHFCIFLCMAPKADAQKRKSINLVWKKNM